MVTGFGAHMALPVLRKHWHADMELAEAKELLTSCMKILYYRDCRTLNRIRFAHYTASSSPTIEEPTVLETKWDYKQFVTSKAGADTDGSW